MRPQAPDPPALRWLKDFDRASGPIYLGLLQALERSIRSGELQPGDQLPPQRAVAERLGIDFTTVTRAYAAARARGLIEGAVGRGTFVSADPRDEDAGLVDLSMNLPPPPQGLSLSSLLKDTAREVLERTDAAALMAYHPGAGSPRQRAAAATWLAPLLGEVSPERLRVCPGAQTALAALVTLLVPRGGGVVVEPLTYPGLIALAAQTGVVLIPCPVDAEGYIPAELERLCAEARPAAVYCVPTQQNPLAFTMGLARRREIAAVIERAGVTLIEDDAYGRLSADPAPAIASFAPTRSWYVATLAKALSPGLRTAFVGAPDAEAGLRLEEALRALSMMTAPLMTAIAVSWIRDGTADALLAGVRCEAIARRALVADILPAANGGPEALHVWLDLPARWDGRRLIGVARERKLALVAAEAFAAGPTAISGVRISLGAAVNAKVLGDALRGVAALVAAAPSEGRVLA